MYLNGLEMAFTVGTVGRWVQHFFVFVSGGLTFVSLFVISKKSIVMSNGLMSEINQLLSLYQHTNTQTSFHT